MLTTLPQKYSRSDSAWSNTITNSPAEYFDRQVSIFSKSTFPNVEFGTAKFQHMIQHCNMYKCQLKTNSYTNQEGKLPVTVQ